MIKPTRHIHTPCILITMVCAFGTNSVFAADLAEVSPDSVKILIDNDRVRVLDVVHKPGGIEPMHSHPAYVIVSLDPGDEKTTLPDGATKVTEYKTGEVRWSGPVTHSVETIGKTNHHLILIELKR